MTGWEYEIRRIDPTWTTHSPGSVPDRIEIIEGYLNGMGEEGWELVGFIPQPRTRETNPLPIEPNVIHAVFKRPK